MNYEHYGGSGSLPLRRRGANDAASQKFNGHQASNKFEGIGTFNPDDNRRGVSFSRCLGSRTVTFIALVVAVISLAFSLHTWSQFQRMSSDLERRFNNRLKTVAAQHGNGAGDALDRVGDLEIKSKELEAELIQLSQELAEQDQKWAEVEEQFSNLNRGVVELMKDQTTSQNSSDMSQVTSRMQSVERSLGRLDNMMTLFQSQDQSKILAARVRLSHWHSI